ncbi:gluzincin family metallopeptidase [Flavobacterium restrictum]|uniref:M1 family metallopeptidase n=1 Tax=Flavobacterium restrictum TaxID=2594428 RepID=A0A553DSL9_9FLAO|nr:M1 family metallopeptidase [Flavobacterium restrictum]TRX35692.1 M1 family metallopeptidase [Flavobacterium restrictum]
MIVEVNLEKQTLHIQQALTFTNLSSDTLTTIVLNDWNNAYSEKNTPLANRFSDEFYRGFHLAKKEERGNTNTITIIDNNTLFLPWDRPEKNPDVIVVHLREKLLPNQKTTLHLTYSIKIPSDKFTKYGYSNSGGMNLKNWFFAPARFENHAFTIASNANLDDIANSVVDYSIALKIPKSFEATTDLDTDSAVTDATFTTYHLKGENRTDFSLFIEPKSSFTSYKNALIDVNTNLKDNKLDEIQKAIVIDKIVHFTNALLGNYPHQKILVSQTDYERNPFYGLNQLPPFISPFTDEFLFEIKFLKTYLNNYLKYSLRLDPRKDNWIYDGIQIYAMMKYIDENHPNSKMMGSGATLKLLKSYNLVNLDFNEQYSYFYMLMARKNLDQALGAPKNTLIKFNEQIASKYRAGLSFRFLDNYLDNGIVDKSMQEFYSLNQKKETNALDFETLIKSNTPKNIDWFFKTVIYSRDLIDYKFSAVSKTKDSVTFSIKNKTNALVPVPVYGVKNGNIVFKKWLEADEASNGTFTIPRLDADKIILNYKNEVPEYNLRNNWKKLEGFFPNNRPIKFAFMKDLEDPYYNQILYAPIMSFNVYDGFTPGIRFHNKTILNKPFTFDLNPTYSLKTQTLSGSASFALHQDFRDRNLYAIRYSIGSSYFHYAPDATYFKLNPMVQLQIRNPNFRDNRKQVFLFRQVIVNREKSMFITDNSAQNYSVFDAKYINSKTEVTNHVSFTGDFQLSKQFGKLSGEMQYRKLFENKHEINLRVYAGHFLYNNSHSDFFSFALDRPTDYLFDYNYYGRSESTGFFSRQFILAEGGFKSKMQPAYANQWISTLNASYSIWKWIDFYGDLGGIKSKNTATQFVYDSGIRLNLVTDYFELYFPVYSTNGWEISQNKYNEKIRFVITLDPSKLTSLFTRKWF